MSGGCSVDRHGLLTFQPVADSAGGGERVNNGDVPVTSGHNCSEVWWWGGSCHKFTRGQIGWSAASTKDHLHLVAGKA